MTSDIHYHVLVSSLFDKTLLEVHRAESSKEAEELRIKLDKDRTVIASIPVSPCSGNCSSA